ncbi:hypothetical protein SAMN05421824_0826 [Hyunsoonleella jejuensis]|uniref:Uncharacterized protein n=1 Tax=Hyunsoonleella jejuensis TaxID=419940 RepID=A0A1H9C7L8_9FLAO|nr:hypothetical protein [Hyunsoonleella jejuensis]SEP97265.1 hypothetical protein SAMN05421824_0826 [Hyunsoonleella jejuensis]
MKALKITLILAVLFASLTSCVKQDLNEDDLLENMETKEIAAPITGGGVDQ